MKMGWKIHKQNILLGLTLYIRVLIQKPRSTPQNALIFFHKSVTIPIKLYFQNKLSWILFKNIIYHLTVLIDPDIYLIKQKSFNTEHSLLIIKNAQYTFLFSSYWPLCLVFYLMIYWLAVVYLLIHPDSTIQQFQPVSLIFIYISITLSSYLGLKSSLIFTNSTTWSRFFYLTKPVFYIYVHIYLIQEPRYPTLIILIVFFKKHMRRICCYRPTIL